MKDGIGFWVAFGIAMLAMVMGLLVGWAATMNWDRSHPYTIEKNITVPVASICPNVTVSCPSCPNVTCPSCPVSAVDDKCYCKAMGGYAQDKVWWYADNQTTGYTP